MSIAIDNVIACGEHSAATTMVAARKEDPLFSYTNVIMRLDKELGSLERQQVTQDKKVLEALFTLLFTMSFPLVSTASVYITNKFRQSDFTNHLCGKNQRIPRDSKCW